MILGKVFGIKATEKKADHVDSAKDSKFSRESESVDKSISAETKLDKIVDTNTQKAEAKEKSKIIIKQQEEILNDGSLDKLNPFLDAWYDPLSNLKILPSCVKLGDVYSDGDYKLLVCDLNHSLKVFKGISLMHESPIIDTYVPIALSIVYSDTDSPRIPSVAIAASEYIFIYRHFRPYKKWLCPHVEIESFELEIWNEICDSVSSEKFDLNSCVRKLYKGRDNGFKLSPKSLGLLELENNKIAALNYIQSVKSTPMIHPDLITCMDTLPEDSDEVDSLAHLIVGTESNFVFVLPINIASESDVMLKVPLPSTPSHFCVVGQYLVEWRIFVATRDCKIYSIREGDVRGTAVVSGSIIDVGSQVVALAKADKSLWVASVDKMVVCYSKTGKRLQNIVCNSEITDIAVMYSRKSYSNYVLAVSLINGLVMFYRNGDSSSLVYMTKFQSPIVSIKVGRYGREDNSMIFIDSNGSLSIKMWKRSVEIEKMTTIELTDDEIPKDMMIPVPNKKLYQEQTQREKELSGSMHRAFHKDLSRFRLETAKAYVKTLTEGFMGTSVIGAVDLRVQAQVLGLGPIFVLKVNLQNSGSQVLSNCLLMFSFDKEYYAMGKSRESSKCIPLPNLLPGVKHIVESQILSIDKQGRSGQVMLIITEIMSKSALPLLSAAVKMPPSELT